MIEIVMWIAIPTAIWLLLTLFTVALMKAASNEAPTPLGHAMDCTCSPRCRALLDEWAQWEAAHAQRDPTKGW